MKSQEMEKVNEARHGRIRQEQLHTELFEEDFERILTVEVPRVLNSFLRHDSRPSILSTGRSQGSYCWRSRARVN